MSALPIREGAITEIEKLSDEQVAKVLDFIRSVRQGRPPYSEENDSILNGETAGESDDPAIGFFSGPSDLAETSEEILWKEFGLKKPQDNQSE